MASSEYNPVRVTAKLRGGVVSDAWLPLDGIVYWQALRYEGRAPDQLMSGRMDVPVDLPFARLGTEADWYYACSWAQPQPWWEAEGRSYWTNLFDLAWAGLIRTQRRAVIVQRDGGPYKAKKMPVFYRVAREVCWYAVADIVRLRKLLCCVTHIGKHPAQGWGRVTQWDVEPMSCNASVVMDGQLTRGVPLEDAAGQWRAELRGLRPPYFDQRNQRMLAVPR